VCEVTATSHLVDSNPQFILAKRQKSVQVIAMLIWDLQSLHFLYLVAQFLPFPPLHNGLTRIPTKWEEFYLIGESAKYPGHGKE
jgi:hypothetical protein